MLSLDINRGKRRESFLLEIKLNKFASEITHVNTSAHIMLIVGYYNLLESYFFSYINGE